MAAEAQQAQQLLDVARLNGPEAVQEKLGYENGGHSGTLHPQHTDKPLHVTDMFETTSTLQSWHLRTQPLYYIINYIESTTLFA